MHAALVHLITYIATPQVDTLMRCTILQLLIDMSHVTVSRSFRHTEASLELMIACNGLSLKDASKTLIAERPLTETVKQNVTKASSAEGCLLVHCKS